MRGTGPGALAATLLVVVLAVTGAGAVVLVTGVPSRGSTGAGSPDAVGVTARPVAPPEVPPLPLPDPTATEPTEPRPAQTRQARTRTPPEPESTATDAPATPGRGEGAAGSGACPDADD